MTQDQSVRDRKVDSVVDALNDFMEFNGVEGVLDDVAHILYLETANIEENDGLNAILNGLPDRERQAFARVFKRARELSVSIRGVQEQAGRLADAFALLRTLLIRRGVYKNQFAFWVTYLDEQSNE